MSGQGSGKPPRTRFRTGPTVALGAIGANVLTLVLPLVMIQLFDRVIPNAAGTTLTVLGAVLLGAVLIEAALRYGSAALLTREGTRYAVEAERRLIHQVLRAPRHLDGPVGTGRHLEAWETIDRVRGFYAGHGRHSAVDLPFALLFLGVFWMVAPPLVWVLIAILAVALLSTRINRGALNDLNERRRDHAARLGGFATEVLGGAEHIKGLSAEPLMMRRQESLSGHAALVTEELTARQSVAKTLVESIGQATPILIAITGAFWVNAGTLTTGALAAAILLSGRIVQPVLRARDQAEARRSLAPLEAALNEIIDAPPVLGGARETGRIERLALEGATVSTPGGLSVLRDVSLDLRSGDCVAISGASGAGKTTLMRLLSGRLTPSEGQLMINGAPVEAHRTDAVTAEIAMLSQRGALLSGSVLDLITGFRGDACLPDALEVAEELGLARFLASRDEGFLMETQTGAGRGLPGSVAALLPIAAALARRPSVLLFDEANTALDAQSDYLLRAALARRVGSCILVMITQRPSFAALARRHYRIEDGQLLPDEGAMDLALVAS
ncbi:MAG: ATP-binding cassette domain-containing protein [Pseudomonadota bacterium]